MQSSDNILEEVKSFASEAHGEQKRKYTPEPYIVHPIRVMEICKKYTDDVRILSAALLHDVLEDTSVTEKEMFQFLNSNSNRNEVMHLYRFLIRPCRVQS